jgi:hypothetical protein
LTEKERDHQIDVFSLILGVEVGALRDLGYLRVEEVSEILRIVKREDRLEEKDS